ncbi:MAG: tryptophan--tRNA ligase [Geminicoccaceae bacterium]|nr:tryptophan--tRNA ligase [Geminicoccaceae bacterium]
MKGRIFSGIQPTHGIHLGNYLGALRNWVRLQDGYECVFCIVDLHALTLLRDAGAMRRNVREVAAAIIASGVDPERSTLFVQSHAPEHAQLAWVLQCVTPLGWLNRMTQFKEKAGKNRENAPAGLYTYPVLQAADILLYKATHVPVGEDQKQHIELARDIAGAFNRRFDTDLFPLPEPMIQAEAARVMSLRDGTRKMSKSDPSDMTRINLVDDRETIAQKIRKAKSDSVMGVSYDPASRPEASNLLQIYAALADMGQGEAVARFKDASFADFKADLADLTAARLGPITERMRALMAEPERIDAVLADGAERARASAAPVLAEAYEAVGFR